MPNRLIKETIRTSKNVNALTDFQFRVWVYLVTYVDDFGRGSADPEILKGFVFPRKKGITEQQIEEALHSLANSGMIQLYEVEGESYFCFQNWERHQQIRAKKSKFPAPASNGYQMISDDIKCSRNPIQSNTNTESESEYESNARAREEEPPKLKPREDEKDDGFQAFWSAYPKKNGGDIREAFMEYDHVTDALGVPKETLIKAANELAEATDPADIRYLPNAAKWLRNRGWKSKVAKAAPKSRSYTTAAETKPRDTIDVKKIAALESLIQQRREKSNEE